MSPIFNRKKNSHPILKTIIVLYRAYRIKVDIVLTSYIPNPFTHYQTLQLYKDSTILGRLVWAKLAGYPWWPSMICNNPSTGKTERKREVHVQFFDDPVTRSWIDKDLIKPWSEKVLYSWI